MPTVDELKQALANKERQLAQLTALMPSKISLKDELLWAYYAVQDDIISLKRQIYVMTPIRTRTVYPRLSR